VNLAWTVRACIRYAFALSLRLSGVFWRAEKQIRDRGGLVVLTFHRVLTAQEFETTYSHPGIVVSRDCFRRMLGHIRNSCTPVRLSEAQPGHRLSKLGVVLTFDDGWKDNYTNAIPEAVAAGCPLTVMICPGLVGLEAPFWPERAIGILRQVNPGWSMELVEVELERLKRLSEPDRDAWFSVMEQRAGQAGPDASTRCGSTMSWDEIRETMGRGIEFGAHTQTHRILDTVGPEQAAEEIGESKRCIEQELQTRCNSFAYPNGNVTEEIARMVSAAGIALAVTTAPGVWTGETDRLRIPRINMSEDNVTGPGGRFSSTLFQYAVIWKAWRAWRAAEAQAGAARLAAQRV